jgi:radical SAM-linked protein
MSENPTKQRLLITFGKSGALKYTSNLDVAKIWERVLRRAGLPLLYSQGFNIRPRIQLASALPLGISSECELLDVSLKEVIDLNGVRDKLITVSPPGLDIYKVENLSIHYPALQTLVRSTMYRIHFADAVPDLQDRIDALLARDKILKTLERKNRAQVYDLRPLIYSAKLDDMGNLIVEVAVGDQGNVRPEDLIYELDLAQQHYTVHRQRLDLAPFK